MRKKESVNCRGKRCRAGDPLIFVAVISREVTGGNYHGRE